MGDPTRLCFFAGLCQMVTLSCVPWLEPVVVEVAFGHFPSGPDPDLYLVNFRNTNNHTEWLEAVHPTSCSPDCRAFQRLAVVDPRGYDITLRAIRRNATVATKTFHLDPVPFSSLQAETTTTTALLTCTLQPGHTLTALGLQDPSLQSSTHTCQTGASGTRCWSAAAGLQAGTRYSVQASLSASLSALNITSTQSLHVNIETAKCPIGWLARGRSCYSVRRRGLTWVHAQSACRGVARGVHLVDLKTLEDLLFLSAHLLTHNSLLLLWTALNDRKEEGDLRWSDGSAYNLTNEMTSSLLSNQTDCFALQRNATGPGYFLTPFFCGISLPFICHHQIPAVSPSFSFEVVQVAEREVELGWGDLSPLNSSLQPVPQVYVRYEEEDGGGERTEEEGDGEEGAGRSVSSRGGGVRVPVSLSARVANMSGLSPGKLYSVSLTASDPAGASWSLGRIHTVHTRPLPPQKVSVSNITANQITVHWVSPEAQHAERWRFVVRWVDVSSGQERAEGVHNVSRRSGIGGLETYSAVIGQLKSFRKYKVGVHTVTQGGVESCGDASLIRTAPRPPGHLTVSSDDGKLTVCWTPPTDQQPDGYEVTAHPGNVMDPSPLWVDPSSPRALRVHESVCVVEAGPLTPGQTYEVGVVSVRESSRSLEIRARHTTEPCAVPLAVPLSAASDSAVVFVQTPHLCVFDGVEVCACEGRCDAGCRGRVCEEVCERSPFSPDTHSVTLGNLRPGVEYQLSVYATSKDRRSPPYYTQPIRTCLAPPSRVREGEVTASSIELQWDPVPGHDLTYEVMCLDCDHTFKVLKVSGQKAVFTSLTPGRLYHFRVRTEKERFTDSPAVTLNLTAAPSPVEVEVLNKTTASVTLVWSAARGVVSGYVLSIKNQTSNQQLNVTSLEHRFEHLASGSFYTVQVSSTNGERMSVPATVKLSTIPEVPQEVMLIEQGTTSVLVSWRPPPGEVKGYKLSYGLVENRMLWHETLVQGTSLEIGDLTPGSDYGLTIQTLVGSDTSQLVNRDFYTRPAGVLSISLLHVNSSCAVLRWDAAIGHFDFHRVTLAEGARERTLSVSKEETAVTLAALRAGCGYNVSVERVRRGAAGAAASLTVTTIPEGVRGLRVASVSPRAFSLRWERPEGCVERYHVSLQPSQGRVAVFPTPTGHIQANVVSVSPGTQFTVTVTADSSSNISPPVSRIVNTNLTVPGTPFGLDGQIVGSNGLLLTWSMPADSAIVDGYVIRYKEMCPYPDLSFTQVTKYLYVPETLLNDFTPGSTYNIQVAGENSAGVGPFSKSLYKKTAEAPPGLVNKLTAFAANHTFVEVTWYLPERINGLITKFAVKAKHAGQTVRTLELNAEDIMTGALPHCNDAADILSHGTSSPSEVTASSPPITLSAVPPAAAWKVPISVGVDKLRPYTAYVFEVSAFTSDGEGQIATTMVRMPESAPEDPPQNLSVWNVTSKSVSLSWDPPSIITGRFSYVVYLYGPTGLVFENSTGDLRLVYSGLTPYTSYRVEVKARSAGEVGPQTHSDILTLAEAPSAVQNLTAVAEDSVSVLVSWRLPAQPNGLITRYRLLVLSAGTLLQNITLYGQQDPNGTGLYGNATPPLNVFNNSGRRKRSADFSLTSSPPAFTVTLSERASPTSMAVSSLTLSASAPANSLTPDLMVTASFLTSGTSLASMAAETGTSPNSAFPPTRGSVTYPFSVTSAPKATPPPWLTNQPQTRGMTSYPVSPGQPRLSTRSAFTGNADVQTHPPTQAASTYTSGGVLVTVKQVNMLLKQQSYLVTGLSPFTEYTFRVTAATVMGDGPATHTTEMTREQVPSSVVGVSYQNISSTSILVRWSPPQSPNGLITHYTVYGLRLNSNQALQRVTPNTSILLTGLEKYTGYKLRVAASTAVGESSLSDKDDIFVVTPEDEPDSPPRNLTVVETTPSTATLTWSPPEKANGVIQQYEVLYENQSFSASLNSSSPRVTLSQLKPYSYYNVSVRAYTRQGHGNHSSHPLHMLSGEDVPGSAPYDLTSVSVSPSEVNVTWQPPLIPNGVITHYSMQLWNSSHYLNLTSPTSHATITHLRKYARYRLTVQAHTHMGPGNQTSDPLNITTLEDVPDTPPQFLQAKKLSDYQVELSWEPPLEANSDILYYLVRIWNETSEQWQNVTETVVVISVDSESRYNASVSSWTRLGDGGVIIYISFTTTDAEPFDPPQNVTVVNVTSSAVTVLWNPPTQPNGIITHYTILYMDNSTLTQQRAPVSVLAPGPPGWLYSYRLAGLLGGSNYSLWMTSSTMQGDGGVSSAPLTVLTPESVPSDPVHNLSAQIFSSTAIIVSWDPPQEPNGRPFYLLTLQEAGHIPGPPTGSNAGPPAVNKTISKTTTDTVFLFTKLRKYFPYVFTVTPATGAGPALNHTSTLHLRTDDDIPSSAPVLVSSRNLSFSSISVVWQPPLEANGEITKYLVTLSGPNTNTTGSATTQTPDTSLTLTQLQPYTPYNLSITAVTRKGSGPALLLLLHTDEAGPMSPPRNLSIYNHTAYSVWLSWEPSLEPNGVVTHYGFRIYELNTHTVSYQNSSGPWTVTHLGGFRPHSSYEISVCSYTRVGHGDQFSLPVSFTTNESVSDAVRNLSCSGVSWDSVELSWEPPTNPNGQILFYQIQVDSPTHSLTRQAPAPHYLMSGLRPDGQYTLTVTAVNSAGPGEKINCTADTHPESVPGVPLFLDVSGVTPTTVTLRWAPPLSASGMLTEYHVTVELISTACQWDESPGSGTPAAPGGAPGSALGPGCVESRVVVPVNGSAGSGENRSVTLQSLFKYRQYRFRVAALTNAGEGEATAWSYTRTLAGKPDAPPRALVVTPTSNSLRIQWDAPTVLSGPTSYLVDILSLDGIGVNLSLVRAPGEMRTLVVSNLTAFTRYSVTVTAFTGLVVDARTDGKASPPLIIRTLEEEPRDPPTNVTLLVIPEEVTRVLVNFAPPEEPNGNISSYTALVYREGQLHMTLNDLAVVYHKNHTLTAVIYGLKGGLNYSIRIAAVNGAGLSPPSPEVEITTGIKAPAKPNKRPQAMVDRSGVAIVTSRSISIIMPHCYYSDDNGPISRIQVIVAESGVMDSRNLTNWQNAFLHRPAPYLTDSGFLNPPCVRGARLDRSVMVRDGGERLPDGGERLPDGGERLPDVYVIGEDGHCLAEERTDVLCNGPLKPNTVYVFKFRATNINGQYTDSDFSDHVRTAVDGLLTRDEQIILGVLLSFFLAVLLIIIIYTSVRIRQRQKEGGTYSPREAEIIETKFKLDQLIAVADLELKEEKLHRYSSFFFRRKEIFVIQLLSYRKSLKPINKKSFLQHVEDLCANDNSKFQEEFAELPKLLQDLATSDADLPWNRSKNRFTNIKPYNNNRVKLLSEPGMPGSDYINASFISGYLCPNEFIATQGPLPGTVADFWRMIWETRTRTIAMLTQCYEKGRIRCHQYWPEDNKPVTVFGDIIITKLTEDVYPDWTVRALKVERYGDYMVVHHFNYTSWPEHGVPESSSTLIQFVKAIRANRHDNTTMVVHCSAGVGRTGVFIALDHLIQHISDHDFVDVYGLVAELRRERMCMVQNLAQYMFLHQSTLDLLSSKGNSQSIWFVNYSALEKMDSLDAMEGDIELEWEETTM